LPQPFADKLRVLHTPGDPSELSFADVFEQRQEQNLGLKAIWAGRFDRQKRFDIVKEIARKRPDIEIYAWGKRVLGDAADDGGEMPPNIKLMGTYESFDDLPWRDSSFLLNTSEWDGVPTILIDAGNRAIPVVGSNAGGTTDILTEETGWPVHDLLNPDAYIAAIDSMCADPAEVTRRAINMKKHVAKQFSAAAYVANLGTIVGKD
jgi:glycosyltransferase involved in cell wall biosynthesis